MKNCLKYLFLILALGLSNAVFGQFNYGYEEEEIAGTSNVPPEQPERRGIVERHGGSANRGIVYFFYENPLNVGRPHLQFIDTTKSLFHRYDPIMRNNAFRSSRGNLGLISDDLEFIFRDDILFSYGRSPFEIYRFTPFNTKFYQNTVPYVELYYVLGGGNRMQNFRMLFAQNVMRGLNIGAEYNILLAPGVYNRMGTRHDNIRVFSNFISQCQRYRVVAGYFFNHLRSQESGGILANDTALIFPGALQQFAGLSNKRVIPIRLQQAENTWRENSFYLRQTFHFDFGIGRNRNRIENGKLRIENGNGNGKGRMVNGERENGIEIDYVGAEHAPPIDSNYYENGIENDIEIPRINFGSLSHAFEFTRFHTMFDDRNLQGNPEGFYPTIPRNPFLTEDSTFVELMRNTFAWSIGDVTSFQNSQFLNLSFGATIDFARIRTDIPPDTVRADGLEVTHRRDFNRNFSYLYPFARARLNFRNQYFLSGGVMYQMDLNDRNNSLSAFSADARLDYFFNRNLSNDGLFAEANFSRTLPRPFQQFHASNHFNWDTVFNNPETLRLAVGGRWRGFQLSAKFATFYNFIYLTPTQFAQSREPFSIFKTSLEKTFRFWRILAFDTRLVFQHNTSETVMQIPQFVSRNALYFDFMLLGITPTQVGFEAFHNTRFHSRFFNPALGMFYDQQQLQTGGFAFVDAFLHLRIARANVFFKLNNIGANLWGYNYMTTNGFPIPYRTFSFGVLWRFYD